MVQNWPAYRLARLFLGTQTVSVLNKTPRVLVGTSVIDSRRELYDEASKNLGLSPYARFHWKCDTLPCSPDQHRARVSGLRFFT
jgi:hypothetical protein